MQMTGCHVLTSTLNGLLICFHVDESNNSTISALTPKLIPVFEKVLSPPEDQLTTETRELVKKMVQILYTAKPDLFQANPGVVALAA